MSKNGKKFKVLSLFTGGMGLDLGLESTGRFETIICIEKEKIFCDTIRRNCEKGYFSHNLKVIEADISKLDPKEVLKDCGILPESIDIIAGGPPCQSFSTAGTRGTVQDPRGTLLWDFLRFVEFVKPKFFLMENVRGLLSAAIKHRPIAKRPEQGGPLLSEEEQPGSVVRLFAKDLAQLSDISYNLDIFEVNAVNYGAPQIRERVLFIGNVFGMTVDFPAPTHSSSRLDNNRNGQLSLLESSAKLPWKTLGEALEGLEDPEPVVLDFSPRKKSFLELVPPGCNWRSLPEQVQKESMGRAWYAKGGRSGWWRRLSFDLPSPTLITMPNHASTSLCHPTETRALSIKEYARIQEFPDEWEFVGTVSKQYAQVGNAVPIRLGYIAGKVIADALDKAIKRGLPVTLESTGTPRIVYLQSHVRTRQWYKDGEVFTWKDGQDNEGIQYSSPKTTSRQRTLSISDIDMAKRNSHLPKATAIKVSRKQILSQLLVIDSDKERRERVLRLENAFRRKIDSHIVSLPESDAKFRKFNTSPYVLLIHARQKKYTKISEIEADILPAKQFSSMETSAGRMVEEVVLPEYGWECVTSEMHSTNSALDGKKQELSSFRLATLKSGPRCLNDEMSENFADAIIGNYGSWASEAGVTNIDFTYGVLYGTYKQSNKKDWHILRNIKDKKPSAITIDPSSRWNCQFKDQGITVSVAVRVGLDWWSYLGGEYCFLEVFTALIRACINAGTLDPSNHEYTISDLKELVTTSGINDDYNVSLLQRSQIPWLFLVVGHFCDELTD